ncbi:hypothetical protein VNO77_39423 [Canavalia gladiata]|uniref:Uncharacterized protein n=1 Tax=Canavalia gladiata TaxID=3824 RepID=A0AAN9PVT0_CANGL
MKIMHVRSYSSVRASMDHSLPRRSKKSLLHVLLEVSNTLMVECHDHRFTLAPGSCSTMVLVIGRIEQMIVDSPQLIGRMIDDYYLA